MQDTEISTTPKHTKLLLNDLMIHESQIRSLPHSTASFAPLPLTPQFPHPACPQLPAHPMRPEHPFLDPPAAHADDCARPSQENHQSVKAEMMEARGLDVRVTVPVSSLRQISR